MGNQGFFGQNMVGQDPYQLRGELDGRLAANTIPVGVILPYAGVTAPSGWLICNGTTFSSSSYPALAALLGGTTLPDLRGRVAVGYDATQTEFNTLRGTGGAKTLALASANLPPHTHGLNGHNHGGATISGGGSSHDHGLASHNHGGGTGIHSHTFNGAVFGTSNTAHTHYVGGSPGEASAAPQGTGRASSTAVLSSVGVANSPQGATDTTHTHSTTVAGDSGVTTNGGFAGTAAAALPPYMTLNHIIKAA